MGAEGFTLVLTGVLFSLLVGSCSSFVVARVNKIDGRSLLAGSNEKLRSRTRRSTLPTARLVDSLGERTISRERLSATVLWSAEDGNADPTTDEGFAPTGKVAAAATATPEGTQDRSRLPFYLDPSTRGGAVVVPTLSLLLPLGAYGALTALGVDGNKAGAWVGVGYTLVGLIAWVGSYFFRVATKNMTYAVQLKNYEQAVIEKRFSELEEDEKDALLDEVNET